jgi:hypothetical protein
MAKMQRGRIDSTPVAVECTISWSETFSDGTGLINWGDLEMRKLRKAVTLAIPLLLLAAGPILARQPSQQAAPQSQSDAQSTAGAQGTTPDNGGPDQSAPSATAPSAGPACWREAGISQKAMRTRQSIMSNAKTQIQKVNDDTSLGPQQQRRQIRQIRQNARQQIARVVTPEQEQALQGCQRLRKGNAAHPDTSPANPPEAQPN